MGLKICWFSYYALTLTLSQRERGKSQPDCWMLSDRRAFGERARMLLLFCF